MTSRRIALLSLFAAGLLGVWLAGPGQPAAAAARPAAEAAAPAPRVRFETTLGDFEVELFPDKAPKTVENFLDLVDSGFYQGLVFHRVVAGFVIQTGGYDAGMNYREPPRTVVNESANGLANRRGTLAMARLNDPDSADSQFFINVKDNTHLNATRGQPGYTVFGRVVEGMDVVTEIELADAGRQGDMVGVPETPIVIERTERLDRPRTPAGEAPERDRS